MSKNHTTLKSLKQHLEQKNSIPMYLLYKNDIFKLSGSNPDCTKYSYSGMGSNRKLTVTADKNRKILSIKQEA